MTDLDLSEEQIAEIERGCEGVTPGPWEVYDGSSWRRIGTAPTLGRDYDDCAVLYPNVASDGHPDMHAGRGQDTYKTLRHIARLDPQTVLALCRLARKGRDQSQGGVEVCAECRGSGTMTIDGPGMAEPMPGRCRACGGTGFHGTTDAVREGAGRLARLWPGGFEDQEITPLAFRPNERALNTVRNIIGDAIRSALKPSTAQADVEPIIEALRPLKSEPAVMAAINFLHRLQQPAHASPAPDTTRDEK